VARCTGTAEAGHYYSYIKERTGEGGRWYLFDDKHVVPWDLKDLRDECFGGDQVTTSYNSSYFTTKQPKLKNAYMLFYQRKKPEPGSFPHSHTHTHTHHSLHTSP
jgi:ubiquitin C-terminal hydrolase